LRYQTPPTLRGAANTEEWLTVKLRYKDPDETESQLVTERWRGRPYLIEEASDSGRFSAAVALFGMLLRDSEFSGTGSFEMVESLTRRALDWDEYGERDAFLQLVALAENLEP
jgi:Ca-activated chloride channel family protein